MRSLSLILFYTLASCADNHLASHMSSVVNLRFAMVNCWKIAFLESEYSNN
jgi:hypothetical protein